MTVPKKGRRRGSHREIPLRKMSRKQIENDLAAVKRQVKKAPSAAHTAMRTRIRDLSRELKKRAKKK